MRERGTVVVSSAGRDKGLWMAVWEETSEGMWLVNGKQHPLRRPKRKNPRHVQATGQQIEGASMATDRELRRALRVWSDPITKGG